MGERGSAGSPPVYPPETLRARKAPWKGGLGRSGRVRPQEQLSRWFLLPRPPCSAPRRQRGGVASGCTGGAGRGVLQRGRGLRGGTHKNASFSRDSFSGSSSLSWLFAE